MNARRPGYSRHIDGAATHLVGTSGWVYDSWKDTVYDGVRRADWLAHYASMFATVEVNATFYRLARPTTVARWAEAVPDDFRFTVKGSRYLTHIKRLADTDEGLERFLRTLAPLEHKLTAILWQLPPNLEADVERLARFLGSLPERPQAAVEFRHRSWQRDDVTALLADHGAMTVAVSGPQFPPADVVTGGRAYVRFHGLAGGYAHDYTDAELLRWVRVVADAPGALAYFNNDHQGVAVRNAQRFDDLVAAPIRSTKLSW